MQIKDKWFVTNGAYLEKSQRPTQMLPDANRMVYNDPIIGSASPAVHKN